MRGKEGAIRTDPNATTAGSTFQSIRRSASSVRVRIVIGYLALVGSALTVSVIIARQVQAARIEREVEINLTQEAEELDKVARGAQHDSVRDLFDAFFDTNAASEDEALYTIPLDGGADPGIRRSLGAPAEISEDEGLIRTWSSAVDSRIATYDTSVGEVRALVVPILAADISPGLDVIDSDASANGTDDVIGVFVAAHFTAPDREELNELVRLLVLAGLVVLVLTTGVAWWLAGRMIAPVRQLTVAARAITHSDLSARIDVEGGNEMAELGSTFNEMVGRLDRGFRAQRRFLDDIAHDLRTPLTIARGHLETLGDDPADRDETVAIVLEELDRIGRSVSDLLILAKAEQPDFLRLQAVDYGDLAADVMQRVSGLAHRTWTIDEAPLPGVVAGVADPDRLLEATLNLAANAAQHTEDGDEINIGVAAADPGSVRLWVRDHGPGIDSDEIDVLFQRYRQGQAPHTRRDGKHHEGIGLGLSIVDAIARAHGGTASYAPTPGGGATFTIAIPLERPDDPDPDDPDDPEHPDSSEVQQ